MILMGNLVNFVSAAIDKKPHLGRLLLLCLIVNICMCVSGGPGVSVAVHGQAAADGAHHQLSPSGVWIYVCIRWPRCISRCPWPGCCRWRPPPTITIWSVSLSSAPGTTTCRSAPISFVPRWTFGMINFSDLYATFKVCLDQCCGFVTFWYVSWSADPFLWPMYPDPPISVLDLQDANKKLCCFLSFSAYFFLKVHLHHFSKKKCHKEVTKQ